MHADIIQGNNLSPISVQSSCGIWKL